MHHLEFSKLSKRDDRRRVESVFRSLLPHMAFLDFEPNSVKEREDRLLSGQRVDEPHLDEELFRAYLAFYKNGLDPLDPKGFVVYLREPGWSQRFQTLWGETCHKFEQLLRGLRTDRASGRNSRLPKLPQGSPCRRHPTWYVYTEALRQFEKGNLDLANCHHYADFFHMIVPISYCDVVVLDKAWQEQARQIQETLECQGLLTHTARVLSYRDLPDLLQALTP